MIAPKPKRETYAIGGPPIGSRSRFMKAPEVFHGDTERTSYGKKSPGGELAKTKGDKSEKPIRPKGKVR